MKFVLLAATACFALSCDDERDTINNDITGTYNLTSFRTEMPVDYDGNGTRSSDLMDETRCYDDSRLTINRDGTYILEENAVAINGTTSFCDARIVKGTWTRSGNSLTTTSDLEDGYVVDKYAFATDNGMSGNTMTITMAHADIPFRDAAGNPHLTSGTVEVTYTERPDSAY
ncbi:lipocalin family protein [Flavobacterium magnum]|nr:lipocalin family protein [Flavobacterium magnum]